MAKRVAVTYHGEAEAPAIFDADSWERESEGGLDIRKDRKIVASVARGWRSVEIEDS